MTLFSLPPPIWAHSASPLIILLFDPEYVAGRFLPNVCILPPTERRDTLEEGILYILSTLVS